MTHTKGVISFSIEKLLGPGRYSPTSSSPPTPPPPSSGVEIQRAGSDKPLLRLNCSEEEDDYEEVNIEESSEDEDYESTKSSSYTDEQLLHHHFTTDNRSHHQHSHNNRHHQVGSQTTTKDNSPSPLYRDSRMVDNSPTEPFNLTDRLAGMVLLQQSSIQRSSEI